MKIALFLTLFFSLMVFSLSLFAGHCNLLYWSNVNMGLGHVAVEIYDNDNDNDQVPTYYMSYAMRNQKDSDLQELGVPEVIKLPDVDEATIEKFREWYLNSEYSQPNSSSYGSTFNLLSHNCSHAALNVIKAFGYKPNMNAHWGQTPRQVRNACREIPGATNNLSVVSLQ
ncbi:MAG: hypothetical protein HQK49_19310 [Oligoflexia bacterium]|nr:hypothetical protein [Oligoflexia bacterium]